MHPNITRIVAALALACLTTATFGDEPPAGTGRVTAGEAVRAAASGVGGIRSTVSLAGDWDFYLDPGNVGIEQGWERSFPQTAETAAAEGPIASIPVPACWEEARVASGYDGVAWYRHTFVARPPIGDRHAFLHFGGVNYKATVWLNGERLGDHEGGYHAFEFDVTELLLLEGENELIVRVVDPGGTEIDGLTLRNTPHAKESWYYNYGGIWGEVSLQTRPETCIADVFVRPNAATGDVDLDITLRNLSPQDYSQRLGVAVSLESAPDVPLAITEMDVLLPPGDTVCKPSLTVESPRPWSPESPNLYRVTLALMDCCDVLDSAVAPFGYRDFTIEGGDFVLNGRRIVLRGLLYQPYYPATFCYPPSDEYVRNEVRIAKEAGFNMIRAHVRVAPPELLAACDRQGLLVFEEPSIGWIHGDLDLLKQRTMREVDGMVLRDRNHPSVVMWGMTNETSGDVLQFVDELSLRARSLDPTRLVFDDSSIFWGSFVSGRCHYYLPGSTEAHAYDGGHPYRVVPTTDVDLDDLATLGSPGELCFVSEYGFGGLTNLPQCVADYGERTWLPDYRQYKGYLDRASVDFVRYSLGGAFADVADMCLAGQSVQAYGALEQTAALRSNPLVDGYIFTQFQDVSWECSAGVVDVWGRPKRVVQAFAEVNAPVYLALRAQKQSLAPGDDLTVEVTVVNDAGLSGECRLAVALMPPAGGEPQERWLDMALRSGDPPERVEMHFGPPGDVSGPCTLSATLSLGGEVVAGTSREILAFSEGGMALPEMTVGLLWVSDELEQALARLGVATERIAALPSDAAKVPVPVIVESWPDLWLDPDEYWLALSALSTMERGACVVALRQPPEDTPLALAGLFGQPTTGVSGSFVGHFHFTKPHAIFDGIPAGGFMGPLWRNVRPKSVVVGEGGAVLAGSVGGHAECLGAALRLTPVGKGTLIESTLDVPANLGVDPLADKLLVNMLRYAQSGRSGRVKPKLTEVYSAALSSYDDRRSTFQTWLLLGPFPSDGARSGFAKAFPPEAAYLAEPESVLWASAERKDEVVSRVGAYVDLLKRYHPGDNVVFYAFTQVYAPADVETRLSLGSDDGVVVWINGEVVWENKAARPARPDQDSCDVTLSKGWNPVLIKVDNTVGDFGFYFNPNAGGLRYSLEGR